MPTTTAAPTRKRIGPQPGPQELFLATDADIAIYGGAAGGGKSWALMLDAVRYVTVPKYTAVIFRRETPQIKNPGGLWDESMELYPLLGGAGYRSVLEWRFGDVKIKMSHMEKEADKLAWQGSQLAFIGFDELTHFDESQFWYMLSRNRSLCKVRPYMRATTNPDPDSWVADLIAWWIDDAGFPIESRSGVLRFFVRVDDQLRWYDSRGEAYEDNREQLDAFAQYGVRPDELVYSFTFVHANIYDNEILMRRDPTYLAKLLTLPEVEQGRLLGGNWKVRHEAGKVFNRAWLTLISRVEVPEIVKAVRFWDIAATAKQTRGNDPDYTAGVLMGIDAQGRYIVLDVQAEQVGPAARNVLMKRTAEADRAIYGSRYTVGWESQPAAAGKDLDLALAKLFDGFAFKAVPAKGDKVLRAGPLASQARVGNVFVVQADWTDEYLRWLHGFPDLKHDDHVDASSGAHGLLKFKPQQFNVG